MARSEVDTFQSAKKVEHAEETEFLAKTRFLLPHIVNRIVNHPYGDYENGQFNRQLQYYTVGVLAEQGMKIRVVRAAFSEGAPAFPNSALFNRAHVQIAVRDTSLIEKSWMEKKEEG